MPGMRRGGLGRFRRAYPKGERAGGFKGRMERSICQNTAILPEGRALGAAFWHMLLQGGRFAKNL